MVERRGHKSLERSVDGYGKVRESSGMLVVVDQGMKEEKETCAPQPRDN
jgi:hypothetical protein